MKKSLLLSAFTLCLSAAFAQYDLTITYNSNSGVSNLQTATKVYMHSGGNDMAGPLDTTCWNYTVGNWGADDGIGLKRSVSDQAKMSTTGTPLSPTVNGRLEGDMTTSSTGRPMP